MGWNFGIQLEKRIGCYLSIDEMYAGFRVLWINLIIASELFLPSNSEEGDSSVVQPKLFLKLERQIFTKQTNWEKPQ